MFALVVHQPWAELMAAGIKRLEHRSWATRHRGPLMIVASQKCPHLRQYRSLPRGVGVAIVNVIDCVEVEPRQYVWVLADVKRTEPLPVIGKRRILRLAFNVEKTVTEGNPAEKDEPHVP